MVSLYIWVDNKIR